MIMEQPNLFYIEKLADGDLIFKEELIQTLINEFEQENEKIRSLLEDKNYFEASQLVHKIKHKISILNMEKSYYIAQEFENNLKKRKRRFNV
jgi:HPt (histidine-containing phosphotransfer) domain-containing protein